VADRSPVRLFEAPQVIVGPDGETVVTATWKCPAIQKVA
jgi:hypothetical protein